MKIAITGAGLIGRIMGLSLLRDYSDCQIDFYEKFLHPSSKDSCGYAAGGMVAPFCELMENNLQLYQLGVKSIAAWQSINKQLNYDVFQHNGTLVLAHCYDQPDFFHLYNKLMQYDAIDKKQIDLLPTNKYTKDNNISGLNTALFHQCIRIKNEGVVNVPLFFRKTEEFFAMAKNINFYLNKEIAENDLTHLQQKYDYIIDTRGLGAQNAIKGLHGIRGESLVVKAPDVTIDKTIRLCHPRYPLYVIPRKNNIYYIGATTIQSQDDSNISVKSTMDLLSALTVIHPGFLEARILQSFSRNRPSFPSGMPKTAISGNIITLNGFYRHGYLLGPVIVDNVINKHILEKQYECAKQS
ncbi:FAD-dependent oxidoreductase [Facilibium subflavum]|uniref:FAD-dependent oxidoreductase n=1 Tax=Facilibium subflavum TaxID=2219058 RepID=UPI0013C2A12F|nr:FAD-dependent oxidoreductase [Facilibium subflavum]